MVNVKIGLVALSLIYFHGIAHSVEVNNSDIEAKISQISSLSLKEQFLVQKLNLKLTDPNQVNSETIQNRESKIDLQNARILFSAQEHDGPEAFAFSGGKFYQQINENYWIPTKASNSLVNTILDVLNLLYIQVNLDPYSDLKKSFLSEESFFTKSPELQAQVLDLLSMADTEKILKEGSFEIKKGDIIHKGSVTNTGLIKDMKLSHEGYYEKSVSNQKVDKLFFPDFSRLMEFKGSEGITFIDKEMILEAPGNKLGSIFGFSFLKNGEMFIVSSVYKNLPAYKAGVRPGYLIKEINDIDISAIDLEAALEIIKKSGDNLKLKVLKPENKEPFVIDFNK